MIEVEYKFRLNTERRKSIQEKMDKQFGSAKAEHQIDKIFLFETDSFDNFKRGDPVMRIRSTDNSISLTYKRSINENGDRVEHELTIDSAKIAENMLKEMGYTEVTSVDKMRRSYDTGDEIITIDDVEKLGSFIEIEILYKSGNEIVNIQNKIIETAKRLNLKEEDLEHQKYDEMMAQMN